METSTWLSTSQAPATTLKIAKMRDIPYLEEVGSLMYASLGTCPDISFTVQTVSRFLKNPSLMHWDNVRGLISAPLIPAGFQWNKIWQEGLLFFFIPVPFIPAEFGHSGIETGMFHGIRRNGMQRNPVVCLFVCLFHTCYQTNHQPNTV